MFWLFLFGLFSYFASQPTPIYEWTSKSNIVVLPLRDFEAANQTWYSKDEHRFRGFGMKWKVNDINRRWTYRLGFDNPEYAFWMVIESNPFSCFLHQRVNQKNFTYHTNLTVWEYDSIEFYFEKTNLKISMNGYPITTLTIQDASHCTAFYCYHKARLFQSIYTNSILHKNDMKVNLVQIFQ